MALFVVRLSTVVAVVLALPGRVSFAQEVGENTPAVTPTLEAESSPTADSTGSSLPMRLGQAVAHPEFWVWVERTSWVVSIIGLAVAVLLGLQELRHIRREQEHIAGEQKRIADELLRRPDVVVGFALSTEARDLTSPSKEATIFVRWHPNEGMSEPIDLRFVAINRGARTARNLVLNYVLPAPVDSPRVGQGISNFSTQQEIRRENGGIRVIRQIEHLHPEAQQGESVSVHG